MSGSGYTRQSVASIVPTAVVRASPINAEFDKLRDAFTHSTSGTTGHRHDGSSDEGSYIPLIADIDKKNYIEVDDTNNRFGVWVEVSSTAVEQVRFQDGVILPVTDNDIDLGSSTYEYRNLYLDGVAQIDTLNVDENTSITGTLNVTGATTLSTATITSVDINGGTIDNTTIGATTATTGSFTTVDTTGQATLASVDIDGGAIDATTIGNTTAAAITGTLITANTNFVGDITGNVTSSGSSTFNNLSASGTITGDVTGDLTGNVTASSGSSTFNNVTINGNLDMDASSAATITNLTAPTNDLDAATKKYVDDEVANLVDSSPGTLDTLNELAAALGDDPNFSTTITNSIATKLPLAGGTMTGAIAMGDSKITGLGTPTTDSDASTKAYVDTQRDTRLALAGGTMTGAIAMSTNKITGLGTPTADADAANKKYIDDIFGDTSDAATSAANAATSATNAATSATNASTSATAAATSATNAAASYDSFDDRYLGAKASSPSVDNDGDALITGALYFDTTANEMRVYTGTGWKAAGSAINGTSDRSTYTATAGQTTFTATYDVGYVDVYMNGIKLVATTDFTATSGSNVVLTAGAAAGDIIDIVAYGTFNVSNTYTTAAADAKFAQVANNLSDLNNASTARTNLGVEIGTDVQAYNAALADISGLSKTDGNIIVADGTNWTVESGATARTTLGLGTTDSPTFATLNATTVDFGAWTVTESGGSLYFATGGVNKMKLDATGNLTVTGAVNANATIT